MFKSRLSVTLIGACLVLAAAWPFRYQLFLMLPSEPLQALESRDGLLWQNGKVFSGRVSETDRMLRRGGLLTITPVIDGVKDGRSVTFEGTEPLCTLEWVAGKRQGPEICTSPQTGKVFFEAHYTDDLLEGERRRFTPEGAPLRVETFRHGVLNGPLVEYHTNGKPSLAAEFKDGKLVGTAKIYNENGLLVGETATAAGLAPDPE